MSLDIVKRNLRLWVNNASKDDILESLIKEAVDTCHKIAAFNKDKLMDELSVTQPKPWELSEYHLSYKLSRVTNIYVKDDTCGQAREIPLANGYGNILNKKDIAFITPDLKTLKIKASVPYNKVVIVGYQRPDYVNSWILNDHPELIINYVKMLYSSYYSTNVTHASKATQLVGGKKALGSGLIEALLENEEWEHTYHGEII